MEPSEAESLLKKLDRRVERIEQFLPTLVARVRCGTRSR